MYPYGVYDMFMSATVSSAPHTPRMANLIATTASLERSCPDESLARTPSTH
jgi:hypothetical protein